MNLEIILRVRLSHAAVLQIRGDHQGMLTRPQSIAQGILQAATAPLIAS